MRIKWQHDSEEAFRRELQKHLDAGKAKKGHELVHFNLGNKDLVSAKTWVLMAEVSHRANKSRAAALCEMEAARCNDYGRAEKSRISYIRATFGQPRKSSRAYMLSRAYRALVRTN